MISQITARLFVGTGEDFDNKIADEEFCRDHSVILADKRFHRLYARVASTGQIGYSGNMDQNEPEYLVSRRSDPTDILVLNMLDIDNPAYVSIVCLNSALEFIRKEQREKNPDKKILICDSKGISMGPSIALLSMVEDGDFVDTKQMDYVNRVLGRFKEIYPLYDPKQGILEVVKRWVSNYYITIKRKGEKPCQTQ